MDNRTTSRPQHRSRSTAPALRLTRSLAAAGLVYAGIACGDIDHTVSMSVVQIRASAEPGTVFFGSGVVVAPDQVATNCHVTRQARSIEASKGAFQARAVSQHADVKRDLCLLHVPGLGIAPAKLGTVKRLRIGEPLYIYGYPRAIGIAFSKGQVRALHAYRHSQIIETSADFTLGNSGGGIFNGKAALIGFPTFLSAGHKGHYYAIPTDWLKEVRRYPARGIAPLDGVSFWEDQRTLPEFLRRPGR